MPKIITGHTGTAHITSDDVGAFNQALIGDNDYLLSEESSLTATLLDNNTIQLSDAEVVMQGTHIRIKATDTVEIETGQSGMQRIDIIVCRYSKDDDGVESSEIDVITGTPSASDPETPSVTQGDIRNGDTLHEMPLFAVELDSFSITAVTQLYETLNSLYTAYQSIASNASSISSINSSITTIKNTVSQIQTDLDTAETNITNLSKNTLLWSGSNYMTASQKITVSSIANQPNGIVLVFSGYSSGSASNSEFHCFTIPKYLVSKHSGKGHTFTMVHGSGLTFCSKYLYITDTTITGSENNKSSGTASSGVAYNNANFVLRYVIGF